MITVQMEQSYIIEWSCGIISFNNQTVMNDIITNIINYTMLHVTVLCETYVPTNPVSTMRTITCNIVT